jgi:hypothetical protein
MDGRYGGGEGGAYWEKRLACQGGVGVGRRSKDRVVFFFMLWPFAWLV